MSNMGIKASTAEIATEEPPTLRALRQLHNQIDNLFEIANHLEEILMAHLSQADEANPPSVTPPSNGSSETVRSIDSASNRLIDLADRLSSRIIRRME